MVHGYHVIFGTYGFWLPNDPRGSWTDFVSRWELVRFGKSTKSVERKLQLTEAEKNLQLEAKKNLKYPEVVLDGLQALAVATGFGIASSKSGFTIWACSVLPQHVHFVLGRHTYQVEQIVNLLKGQATKQLRESGLDPTNGMGVSGKRRSIWAKGKWKVFLDTEEAIENAIYYVEQNPVKEGKPKQNWSFVQPFRGLDQAWVTYR